MRSAATYTKNYTLCTYVHSIYAPLPLLLPQELYNENLRLHIVYISLPFKCVLDIFYVLLKSLLNEELLSTVLYIYMRSYYTKIKNKKIKS